MAGVTNSGFQTKRLAEIITGLKANAIPIFQDLVKPGETVDTSDSTTLGRLIGLIAPDLDELWQASHQVYQAFDPNSATGIALDNIVQYIGVSRRQGSPTVLRASVWGELGVFLPQGQVIRDQAGNRFTSTTELAFSLNDVIGAGLKLNTFAEGDNISFTIIVEEGVFTTAHTAVSGDTNTSVIEALKVVFDAHGISRVTCFTDGDTIYVENTDYFAFITVASTDKMYVAETKKRLIFNSDEDGDIPVEIDTVTTMLTPVYGWLSVTNEVTSEKGSLYETDEELRERFRVSKAVRANNTSEALYSQLLELRDVQAVRVYENMTDAVDTKGLPPHSFMGIVKGGSDVDIGEVVWNNKPLGIASFGNDTVTVRDSQNMERVVYFSRAAEVPVYVTIEISKTDSTFPDDGVEQIRDNVLGYLNNISTFGENVIYTRLFTPINQVQGHQVDLLQIGKSLGAMGTSNIPLSWNEYPVILPENIAITVNN